MSTYHVSGYVASHEGAFLFIEGMNNNLYISKMISSTDDRGYAEAKIRSRNKAYGAEEAVVADVTLAIMARRSSESTWCLS